MKPIMRGGDEQPRQGISVIAPTIEKGVRRGEVEEEEGMDGDATNTGRRECGRGGRKGDVRGTKRWGTLRGVLKEWLWKG